MKPNVQWFHPLWTGRYSEEGYHFAAYKSGEVKLLYFMQTPWGLMAFDLMGETRMYRPMDEREMLIDLAAVSSIIESPNFDPKKVRGPHVP